MVRKPEASGVASPWEDTEGRGASSHRRRRSAWYSVPICVVVGATLSIVGIGTTNADAVSSVWSVTHTPNSHHSSGDALAGVSCTSQTACQAVGKEVDFAKGFVFTSPLAESWTGRWQAQLLPGPISVESNDVEMNGVSCTGSTHCVAVGDAVQFCVCNPMVSNVIESWNGTTWSVAPGPTAGPLAGVSCTGPTFCVAVGSSSGQTLVESWDGTAWSVAPSPSEKSSSQLSGVSCAGPSYCVAVGSSSTGRSARTLIEAWNGTAWAVASSPDRDGNGALSGVSCTVAAYCVAVGSYSKGALAMEQGGTAITPPLEVTTGVLPPGAVGARYSASLSATGGSPPYRWRLGDGSAKLPKGLKLKPTGVISGKPRESGTFTVTVEVLDQKTPTRPSTRNVAVAALSLTIT